MRHWGLSISRRRPWELVDWGVRYPLGARLQEHPRGCDQADGDGTAVALKSQVYAGAETPEQASSPFYSVVPAQLESYIVAANR